MRTPSRSRSRSRSIRAAALTAALTAALPSLALAQDQIQLLADLETVSSPVSSRPDLGAELNGELIFAAGDLAHGRELWKLTATGPVLLRDILPGPAASSPEGFVLFQGRVWFAATDAVNGRELWATDGTTAGTVLVVDLEAGLPSGAPEDLTVCANRLLFTAFETGAGREPHVSNGTAPGTAMIKDVRPGLASSEKNDYRFVCCGNFVLFFADDGVTGHEPWRTDGTLAGTFRLADIRAGFRDSIDGFVPPVCCNGKVFFRAFETTFGAELYATDGTIAGTALVKDIRPGGLEGAPQSLFCFGNLLLFAARSSAEGVELWKSDGTAAGTELIADLNPGSSNSSPTPLAQLGNVALFSAQGTAGRELFVTDGTTPGTAQVVDLHPGLASSSPERMVVFGNRAVFVASDAAHGRELFVTDGTAQGTALLADLEPGTSGSIVQEMVVVGSRVVMSASVGGDQELWASDGTTAGTAQIADLEPAVDGGNSFPDLFTPFGPDSLHFAAETQANGRELYFFDGTQAQLFDLEPGTRSSSPQDLTMVGDVLYFTATTLATGRELFRRRPGQAPELVADLRPGSSTSFPANLTAVDHQALVFRANDGSHGTEPCSARNDGAGVTVHDLRAGFSSSSPDGFTRVQDAVTGARSVLFAADDGVVGRELFGFDGVQVTLEADLEPGTGSSSPHAIRAREGGDAAVLAATVGGDEKVFRFTPGAGSAFTGGLIEQLANLAQSFQVNAVLELLLGGNPLVVALLRERFGPVNGEEPYFLPDDGGNPILVADVNPGALDSNADFDQAIQLGDKLVFVADTEEHGRELFVADLNTASVRVIDLQPGFFSGDPRDLTELGGRIVFRADTPEGPRMFVTDGTNVALAEVDLDRMAQGGGNVFGRAAPGALQETVTLSGIEPHRVTGLGASATPLGFACDGRATTTATTPHLGTAARWQARFGPAGHLGVMALDQLAPAAQSLLGCPLWVASPQALVAAFGNAPGFHLDLVLPNDASLVGARFVLQTLWVDAGPAGGLVTSDAVVLTVGT